MTKIPQVSLGTWENLVKLVDHLDIGDAFQPPYLFRGQEDADWTLKPTLHRAVTNDGLTSLPGNHELLRIEGLLTDKFRAIAATHLPAATLAATVGVRLVASHASPRRSHTTT